jgi:hypothetical protein
MLKDVPMIEPKIKSNLIIATAAGMQLSPKGTNELREPSFNAHVDIFVLHIPLVSSSSDVFSNAMQASDDCLAFTGRQDLGSLQGLAMGHTAFDIVFVEATIKSNRCGE